MKDNRVVNISRFNPAKSAQDQVLFLHVPDMWAQGTAAWVSYRPGDNIQWSPLDWVGIFYRDRRHGTGPLASHWAPYRAQNNSFTSPRTIFFDGEVLSNTNNRASEFIFIYVDQHGQKRGTSSPLCIKPNDQPTRKSDNEIWSTILNTWEALTGSKTSQTTVERLVEGGHHKKKPAPPTDVTTKQTPKQLSPPVLLWHPHPLSNRATHPAAHNTCTNPEPFMSGFSIPNAPNKIPNSNANHLPPIAITNKLRMNEDNREMISL